ncbi:MAG TPA: indole-3-glycerol-phosphate synthase [Steroidobacteraceae bacterium]|nr:indole-3-glycerol-phosphate synthase [Steroidobacteraceae bacterium]
MNGFLERMAASSRARAEGLRAARSGPALRARALASAPPPRLRRRGSFDLIAEFKRRSPSSGHLGDGVVAARATAYAEAGAAAVSVLTEPAQFGGGLEDLGSAAGALAPLGVPVMRKDFIVDPCQVSETRAAGGGGVILILRILSPGQLAELMDCARELALFVLLEAFDETDLERAGLALAGGQPAGAPPVLVGVNCRDLASLAVRPMRLVELAGRMPAGAIKVAESGIETPSDCVGLARAGFDFALVGTALMRCPDPGALLGRMLAAGRSA